MIAVGPVTPKKNMILAENIPDAIQLVFVERDVFRNAVGDATGTSDSFTKTRAFWLRDRRLAQYSLRALLSVGTVAAGRWSMTILSSGTCCETSRIALMSFGSGLALSNSSPAEASLRRSETNPGFLLSTDEITVPQVAVANSNEERVGVQPVECPFHTKEFPESNSPPARRQSDGRQPVATPNRYRFRADSPRLRSLQPLQASV